MLGLNSQSSRVCFRLDLSFYLFVYLKLCPCSTWTECGLEEGEGGWKLAQPLLNLVLYRGINDLHQWCNVPQRPYASKGLGIGKLDSAMLHLLSVLT